MDQQTYKDKFRQIFLFASRKDQIELFTSIGGSFDVEFVLMGSFETLQELRYTSVADLPDLGIAKHGDETKESTYLVIERNSAILVRETPQRRGGFRYIIDGRDNPASVIFTPSGQFADIAFISGRIVAIHDHKFAQNLYEALEKRIKKQFTRVQSFWLSPEAHEEYAKGMRFTQMVRGPMHLTPE